MPAVVSHYLLAERVFNDISNRFPGLDKNLFSWGASGPDIFFAHRVMPWQRQPSIAKLSHVMHNGYAEPLLNYLYEYAQTRDSIRAKSYAFGFVTHYAFDSVAHPYIVGYAEEKGGGRMYYIPVIGKTNEQLVNGIKYSSIYHNKIESELDTIFLMHEKHISIRKFRLENACPNDKDAMELIGEILSSYLTDSGISPDIRNYEIIRAMLDWRRCLFALNDRLSIKKGIAKGMEGLFRTPPIVSVFMRNIKVDYNEDPANMAHRSWKAPADGSVHNENFFELADKAHDRSIELIKKLDSGTALVRSDCRDSFSGY